MYARISHGLRGRFEGQVRSWLAGLNGGREKEDLVGVMIYCEFDGEWWLGKIESYSEAKGYDVTFVGDG